MIFFYKFVASKKIIEMIELLRKMKTDLDEIFIEPTILSSIFYLKQYERAHKLTSRLSGNDLLDWGAGYGHFSYVQSLFGKRVTALSPQDDDYTIYTKVLDSLSKKQGFECKITNDPVILPFADEEFDIAVSCGVLEHVREFEGNDEKSLDELFRILRKSGHLVIAHLPNRGSWIEAYSRRKGRQHHEFLYTKKEIKLKVEEAGFVIKKYYRYGFLPKNMIALFLLKYTHKNWCNNTLFNVFYFLDDILSKVFPWFSQNHMLILQKPQ